MRIELKTTSLHEVNQKCKALGWDPKDTKIVSTAYEDLREPDEYCVKLYLDNKTLPGCREFEYPDETISVDTILSALELTNKYLKLMVEGKPTRCLDEVISANEIALDHFKRK